LADDVQAAKHRIPGAAAVKLLVMGGNRFLGAEIVSCALGEGHEVTVLALDPPRPEVAPHVAWVKADRNDPAALSAALPGPGFDAVIDNIAFRAAHVELLARALAGRFGRYVLTSSVDIYSNRRGLCDEVKDETLEPFELEGAPSSEHYLRGKRACERALRAVVANWAVVRPAIVVGRNDPILPYRRSRRPGRGIGGRSMFFPVRVADGGPILILDDDVRIFHSVWVQDAARALVLAATHPQASKRAFNAVGDEVWRSERLVRALAQACGRDAEIVRVSQAALAAAGLGDYGPPYRGGVPLSSNARLRELGWSPSPAEAWLPKLLEPAVDPSGQPFAARRLQEIALAHKVRGERRGTPEEPVRRDPPKVAAEPTHRPPSRTVAPVGLSGRFDAEASRRWAEEVMNGSAPPHRSYFRRFGAGVAGAIGLGTYRGEPSDEDDALYFDSIRHAVRGGINVLDTAINYRSMRSERVVGRALRDLEASGIPRAAICVVTKGGFVAADAADPRGAARYVQEEFVEPGFLDPGDARRRHSIAPAYLDASLAKSLRNLGLEHVDVYLLHNPEAAREVLGEARFYERLTEAFAVLESRVREGRVGAYGVATWPGLRVPPGHPQHLSLERVVKCARDAAAGRPHLRYVELPMNASRPEASEHPTQSVENRLVPALAAADLLGLTVLTSASLVHDAEATRPILSRLPPVPAPLGVAAASLQLARSVPAIGCALAGMRRVAHVEEALAVARLPAPTSMDTDAWPNRKRDIPLAVARMTSETPSSSEPSQTARVTVVYRRPRAKNQ